MTNADGGTRQTNMAFKLEARCTRRGVVARTGLAPVVWHCENATVQGVARLKFTRPERAMCRKVDLGL
jgi:hypothetical protein